MQMTCTFRRSWLRVYQGGTGTENWQRSTKLTQPQPPHMILNWPLQLTDLATVCWEESSIQTSEVQISTLVNKNLSVCFNILTNFFYNFFYFLIICSNVLMFYFSTATGELIGVEYLYAQTGKTLQNIPDQQEEVETPMDAPDADDEDEGFHVRT